MFIHLRSSFIASVARWSRRDPNVYSTHSARRGGASAYFLACQSETQLKYFGRWCPASTEHLVYMQPALGSYGEDRRKDGCVTGDFARLVNISDRKEGASVAPPFTLFASVRLRRGGFHSIPLPPSFHSPPTPFPCTRSARHGLLFCSFGP